MISVALLLFPGLGLALLGCNTVAEFENTQKNLMFITRELSCCLSRCVGGVFSRKACVWHQPVCERGADGSRYRWVAEPANCMQTVNHDTRCGARSSRVLVSRSSGPRRNK